MDVHNHRLPDYACKFLEMCLMVTADHGPAVSGAHTTIVTARAGKDLVSCLTSGLLTIVRTSIYIPQLIYSTCTHILCPMTLSTYTYWIKVQKSEELFPIVWQHLEMDVIYTIAHTKFSLHCLTCTGRQVWRSTGWCSSAVFRCL